MTAAQNIFVKRLTELARSVAQKQGVDHRALAAVLRQLLIDGDALVHQANRGPDKRTLVKLEFVVNNVPSFTDFPVKGGTHFHAHGIDPGTITIPAGTKTLDLTAFLKLPVLEAMDLSVSVREIIKFVANLDGGVHFTTQRTPEEEEIERRFAIMSILGVNGMSIALQGIARVTVTALKPLRSALVQLPKSLPLLAHYKVPDVNLTGARISFDGIRQFMETDFKQAVETGDGFSFNGIVRVLKQAEPGQRVIYAIGNIASGGLALSIWFDGQNLGATALIVQNAELKASIPNFHQSLFFDNFVHLGVDLHLLKSEMILELWINNRLAAQEKCESAQALRTMTRQTIGAQLDGGAPATMETQEIILVGRPLQAAERIEVNLYLAHEWCN